MKQVIINDSIKKYAGVIVFTFAASISAMESTHLYECKATLEDPNMVLAVAALAHPHIISGSCDNTVKQLDVTTGQCVKIFEGHKNFIKTVAVWGVLIISGSGDNTVKLWDHRNGMIIDTLKEHTGSVSSVVPKDEHFVSGSCDGTVKIWDINMRQALKTFEVFGKQQHVTSIAVDGEDIIAGCFYHKIPVFNGNTGVCTTILSGHEEWTGVNSVCVDHDPHRIISGSDDKTIKTWGTKNHTCVETFAGHTDGVTTVFATIKEIISGSGDKTVKVWNKDHDYSVQTLQGHKAAITSVIKQDDYIVSASYDNTIKVWK